MKKCDECDQTFKSSYFLGRHKVSHGVEKKVKIQETKIKKTKVKLYLTKKIDLSINSLNFQNTNIMEIPYEQFADVSRIITDAYGAIIEKSEMLTI